MTTIRLFFLALLITWVLPAQLLPAQVVTGPIIPLIESAESVFSTGVQAYEDGEYEVAARLFGVAANTYDLHQKTTAALLMRGKSLFQDRKFVEARQVLEQLLQTYPTTRYADEARRVIAMAGDVNNQDFQTAQIFQLGVALPLTNNAANLSQQLFNGIYMAVDQHNANAYDSLSGQMRPKIRLVFKDTQNNAETARSIVSELAEVEQVGAIIGPLFSDEAIAAGETAEQLQVPMIAPLATADAVSRGRNFVFQANPTLTKRGELMARFAVRGLGMDRLGIVTDFNNSESVRMARAFEREVANLSREFGAELVYHEVISDARTWFRLSDELSRDTLIQAEAVYLPINGGNASTLIGGVMGSMDRMAMGGRIRILGDVEWHNLPMITLASNYQATYSNDFYVNPDDSTTIPFIEQYQASTGGREPERLAYVGYDLTRFLAGLVERQTYDPRPLDQLIHGAGLYQGLGIRLDFSEDNVNEAMFYHRYWQNAVELLR